MKTLLQVIAFILGSAYTAWPAAPAPLITLHEIATLTNGEASKEPPVAFEATVTYRRESETTLFVQEGRDAIYVWANANIKLSPGDRVLVRGKAKDSFRPIVVADSVTVLHHGDLPAPVPATFDEMMRNQLDCRRVKIRGTVQSADIVMNSDQATTRIKLLVDGGTIDTFVDNVDPGLVNGLLDADVEVSGVVSARFDGKMQKTGVILSIPSMAGIKVLKTAASTPWTLPVLGMDDILQGLRVKNLTNRVRVQGTITYYQPGSALVLQNGTRSLWIFTHYENALRVGAPAEVTGFPTVHDGFLALTEGEIRESSLFAPVAPRVVTRQDLASSKNIFDLVSVEGQVVTSVREASQDEYVLTADGEMFSAIYRHPKMDGAQLPPMKEMPPGSRVRVSGICILEGANPFDGDVPFDVLMRTPEDIAIVARPSMLSVRNLILLVGVLVAIVIAVGARGWFIESRVRRQTANVAYLERRRRRILEDINGSRPLAEIIEQITELASFRLQGAPCWCQIANGAQLGNCPPGLASLRVLSEEIPARSGASLGTIFAAFDERSKPTVEHGEALAMGAGLATLAIETRRLYSDLVHRSEFDLLTDIENRFSLEKHLDSLIEKARLSAGIFGLIYIDLDEFKLVNDRYGHHVGDIYLQEAASRMKHQLRPGDILARLGGDEFAVVVPVARIRSDVQEIAGRLERCFDGPFAAEGILLQGSASVGIALYPEDAATRDDLLRTADTAMYVAKNDRRARVGAQVNLHEHALVPEGVR